MPAPATFVPDDSVLEPEQVFEQAADLFRVMAAPMRLRIISSLCQHEKNVSELLAQINTTQPNMSQHLNTLFLAGVLGKRREGVQIFYSIADERVASICRTVCMQIAIDGFDSSQAPTQPVSTKPSKETA
jgi:DNA-binding transcriptional ArsR family regulator